MVQFLDSGIIAPLLQSRVNIIGLAEGSKALLIKEMADYQRNRTGSDTQVMVVVADEFVANTFAENWQAFSEQPCAILRPRADNFSDVTTTSRDLYMQRATILSSWLHGETQCLIVPVQCLSERYMNPQRLLSDRQLAVGEVLEPETLLSYLTQADYRAVRLIEGAGQFARRGDVIDVGLLLNGVVKALRISFFDNEIDDLRFFDIATQRSVESVSSCRIPLLGEWVLTAEEYQQLAKRIADSTGEMVQTVLRDGGSLDSAEHYRKLALRDAERIGEQLNRDVLKRWLGLLPAAEYTLFDYLPKSNFKLVVDEPAKVRYRADQAQADRLQQIQQALGKFQVTPQITNNYHETTQIFRQLYQYAGCSLSELGEAGNGLAGGTKQVFSVQACDRYKKREDALFTDIKSYLNKGYKVQIFAGNHKRHERLQELFYQHDLVVPLSIHNLRRGFVWQQAKLVCIGSEDIFGVHQRIRRSTQRGASIELFSDLKRGEYVVHEQHGVGIYEGLKTLETGGVNKDYLCIAYAGSDKLYIPVESLNQITKYIAPEGKKPRITKIGSNEWNRTKQKASESIRKLAVDLQSLYAQRKQLNGYDFGEDSPWQIEFETAFPYEPTPDQVKALAEIKADMASPKVMDRLLCGDVGFGKTEIAFRAMFKAVMGGKQAAMLAPTTVLSRQHYDNLLERMGDFPVRLGLLNRFVPAEDRKRITKALERGELDLIIGTHQLLSKSIKFKDLGLLVVDEEQRFGVNHKEKIKEQYPRVDVLTMSATPIPRTLHMSLSGIRDISTLSAGPDNRRPIQTYVLPYESGIIDEAIIREAARGGQVFYLFNDTYKIAGKCQELAERLPGARIVYAHGKMVRHELDNVIHQFINGEADVLVCTTIIESGVDMPNVNTIVVENADRLGLAQLYQIRGRVGRSERQAYAYITYDGEKILNEDAGKRLVAIRDYTELGSGFKIAMRDLEVRGAGSLLGAEQHGHMESVGYDLYCRMLEDAVAELTGEDRPKPLPETKIELTIDAMIPQTYIDDEGQRMEVYHRINNMKNLSDYGDLLDELIDRYGDPPQAVLCLLDIAYAGKQAQLVGVQQIKENDDRLQLYLDSDRVDMLKLSVVFDDKLLRNKIIFNAGQKPCITLLQVPANARRRTQLLKHFFTLIEQTG